MIRKLLLVPLAIGAVFFVIAAREKASEDAAFGQIESIVRTLSEITGLKEEHPIPYGRMSKSQLRHFLSKRIKKTLKPEEIHADELTLKMFGLVPQNYDLKRSTIDLLTEQAAAFYDYDVKRLFLLEDSSFESETTTLAHELAHALADQHFDLEKFMDEAPSNDDENLAHTAVVEGEASWLMIAYELKHAGKPPVPTPEMLKSVDDSSEESLADYPVLKGSPLYIQQSLLFPYTQGTLFFDAVYHKMGKPAFGAVFTDPPVDSSQILHADRYFAHIQPTKPGLPTLALTRQGKQITEGSIGEFDHQMLLKQYLGKAKALELPPHLRGAQYRILTSGKDHRPVLQYISQWDSNQNAQSYFAAFEKVLHGKWQRCDPAIETETAFAGVADNGYFVARVSGEVVSSVEGIGNAADWQRLKESRSTQAASALSPQAH
jgi:hypothetical protein